MPPFDVPSFDFQTTRPSHRSIATTRLPPRGNSRVYPLNETSSHTAEPETARLVIELKGGTTSGPSSTARPEPSLNLTSKVHWFPDQFRPLLPAGSALFTLNSTLPDM